MTYQVTKTFGHELGLSCVFRQHKANSHCKYLHGYALAFELVFEAETLDARNWVIDFGSLKEIKEWLIDMFDHTLLVAADDPMYKELMRLADSGIADIEVVDKIGCEAFAKLVYDHVTMWLVDNVVACRLRKVTCMEHANNRASYSR
jgi:6-pyruvoyltetrahydropterin/6-carboxytetrahydropterin synthase